MNYEKNKLSLTQTGGIKALSLAVMASLALPMTANASSSEVQMLKEQVEQLNKKVDKLSKGPKVKTKGGGLKVSTKDKKKTFKVGGRFQLDYDSFDGAYNAGNNGETASDLFPRRVRTYISGKANKWDYKLLLDFEDKGSEITMARLRYKGFKNGPAIKIGKIREDISFEALTSSKHITAMSRSMLSNSMSPYFKYGISAYQYFKGSGIRYAIGAYKAGSFGASSHDADGAMNTSLTGRLTWSPIHEDRKALHFGVWSSIREFGGSNYGAKVARGEVRATNVRLVNYAAGGSEVATDDVDQYGVEFAGVFGSAAIQAEFAEKNINAVNSAEDFTIDGYYVTASYFLTGEAKEYKKRGVFQSPKPLSDSGAWEIFVRQSNLDSTQDTTAIQQGTSADVTTLGVNYYVSSKLKFMANYLMADVEGPGTTALVGTHDDGNALTFRVQYLF